jgi:hypothetical protein
LSQYCPSYQSIGRPRRDRPPRHDAHWYAGFRE